MIVVYPMLTTQNISSHVLPGICKALERFVLIYDIDHIAKMSKLGKILTIGGQIAKNKLGVGESLLFETDDEKREREKRKDDIAYSLDLIKKNKVEIETPPNNILSVEPTWVQVQTSFGTKILGIKVIPYPVKTETNLGDMLLADLSLDKIDTLMYKYTRNVFKAVYALARGFAHKLPFMSDKNLEGDPEKDILFASSKYKHNIFCLLSVQELENDEVFRKAGGISKLFNLGWNSIILVDDVNKKASFCMKEFGGLCTSIPYSYLFSGFGKDAATAFKSMDDLQKINSPFFSKKINPSSIFSESIVENKIIKYSNSDDCKTCLEIK